MIDFTELEIVATDLRNHLDSVKYKATKVEEAREIRVGAICRMIDDANGLLFPEEVIDLGRMARGDLPETTKGKRYLEDAALEWASKPRGELKTVVEGEEAPVEGQSAEGP